MQECGRRLGVFLRRQDRAKSEFRRRNIFELYIEEVVEACNRLKGGKLPREKLKEQLQKIAAKRTGGEKTDEVLGKDNGPEGLPFSIIVTPEGTEGDAPVIAGDERSELAPPEQPREDEEPSAGPAELDEMAGPASQRNKNPAKTTPGAAKRKSLQKPRKRTRKTESGAKRKKR